ncbi:MAG: hypothetical protein GX580_04480 [Candidatus Hydrogenedens sp.]|nr:hypothetical protein [Candidatus Hydrogenedentota bacterium]NLF56875.1 hypothetical protein [Candidatus Hydrogenedens sp.]
MRPKLRWMLLALAAAGSLLIPMLARLGASDPPDSEIARRCRESRPGWQSYQEDIKGQVGARLVAQWHGEIDAVRADGGNVTVSFRLSPPWDTRDAALPVLLRLPSGEELLQDTALREGGLRHYHFSLPEKSAPPPWVAVHYPHRERRVALDAAGEWRRVP